MKLMKTLFLVAAIVGVPVLGLADGSNTANPFAGAFVGLGFGPSYVTNKMNQSIDANIEDIININGAVNVSQGKLGVGGNLLGGYNFVLDSNWLLGLQAEYNYNNVKNNFNASAMGSIVSGDTTLALEGIVNGQFKLQQSYGLDIDLGYVLNPTDLLYAGLGWQQTKLKATGDYDAIIMSGDESISSDEAFTFNKTLNGIKIFAGAQESLTDNLSLREDASYTDFSSYTAHVTTSFFDIIPVTGTIRIKPYTFAATLDLIYGFNV